MKYRNGFVSNSSSTCFILDMSKSLVKKLVAECTTVFTEDNETHAIAAPELGRCTAMAIGEEAEHYAKEWCKDVWMGDNPDGLGSWILKWYETLGENLAFIRRSDEGMGGYLPVGLRVLNALAEDEMEYH